jgi:O-antigen ligase
MLCLAAVGFLASAAAYAIAQRHEGMGTLAVLGIIVLGPVGLVLALWATPQARNSLVALRHELRWWHGLWFLLYFSAMIGGFRGKNDPVAMGRASLDLWGALRVGPELIVLGVLMVQVLRRRSGWVRCLFQGLPGVLALYALVCAVSSFWSVYPAWTLYKSLEYLIDVAVLAAALASVETWREYESLLSWTWTIFAVEIAWVWIQWPIWPNLVFGDEGRLEGVYPATGYNAVGQYSAIIAVLALCRLLPLTGRKVDRALYSSLLVFGLATLALAHTRNALAGFVLAAALVLILSGRFWLMGLLAGFAGMGWMVSGASSAVMTYITRGQSEGALETLTGRIDPWTYAWHLFVQHPLSGLGAYAAGRFVVMKELGGYVTMHSDWMELLVGIGLLGIVPFAIAVLGSGWFLLRSIGDRAFDVQQRQIALEASGVLCVLFVHSFFNNELTLHAPLFLLAVLGYAELLRRGKKQAVFRPVRSFVPAVTNAT